VKISATFNYIEVSYEDVAIIDELVMINEMKSVLGVLPMSLGHFLGVAFHLSKISGGTVTLFNNIISIKDPSQETGRPLSRSESFLDHLGHDTTVGGLTEIFRHKFFEFTP